MSNIFAPLVRASGGLPIVLGTGPIVGGTEYMHLWVNDEGAIECSTNAIHHYGDALPFDVDGRLVVSNSPPAWVDQGIPFTTAGAVSIEEAEYSHYDQGVPFTAAGSISTLTEGIVVPGEYFQYYNTDPGNFTLSLDDMGLVPNNTDFSLQVVVVLKDDFDPGIPNFSPMMEMESLDEQTRLTPMHHEGAGGVAVVATDAGVFLNQTSHVLAGSAGDIVDVRFRHLIDDLVSWVNKADYQFTNAVTLNDLLSQVTHDSTYFRLLALRVVQPSADDSTMLGWPEYTPVPPVWSAVPDQHNYIYELTDTLDVSPYVSSTIAGYELITPPTGFSIDNAGLITVTNAASPANHAITVRATNVDFVSADTSFQWVLETGNVPSWGTIPDQQDRINTLPRILDVKPYASSDSGPILSYSLIAPPSGITMLDGVITVAAGTAVNSYVLTVRATNGVGAGDTTFTWTVLEQLVVPQWQTIPNQTDVVPDLPQTTDVSPYVTSNSGALRNWQLITPPTGFSIDAAGVVTAAAGTAIAAHTIVVQVTNDQGSSSSSFMWTIGAELLPPQWQTIPAQTTSEELLPTTLDASTYASSNSGPLTGWSLVAPPAGFSIDGSGVITVAGGTAVGNYALTVEVSNDTGTTQSNAFNWEIELFYLVPQWSVIPAQSHDNDQLPQTLDVSPYVSSNSGVLTGWSLVTPPVGFTIDAAGVITVALGTAPAAHSITVRVSNDEGPSDSAPFTWTISAVLLPPQWSTVPDQNTREDGLPASLDLSGYVTTNSGPLDGWELLTPPAGFTINTAGLVTAAAGVAPAGYALQARVDNDTGQADSNIFNWTIGAFFLPPQWSTIPDQSTQEQLLPVSLDVKPYVTSNHGSLTGWAIVPAVGGFTIDSSGIITVAAARAVDTYSITVRVTNDSGATDSAAFDWDILIAPEVPTWQTIPNRQDRVNTLPQNYDVAGYASSNASSGPLTGWQLVAPPTGFSISGSGIITAAAGTAVAIHTLTVRVSNDIGSNDTTFNWEVQEELLPPQWSTVPNQSDRENVLPQILLMTAYVTSNSGSLVNWTLVNTPAGFSIDSGGTLTCSSPGLGVHNVTVRVTNGTGTEDSNTFTWEVLEELLPPQWSTIPDRNDDEDILPQDYDVSGYVTTNSGALTGWNLKSPPSGFTVDGAGVITAASGTSPAAHSITVAVSNNEGETQKTFAWTINDVAETEHYHEFTNSTLDGYTFARASDDSGPDINETTRTVGANVPVYPHGTWSGSAFTGPSDGIKLNEQNGGVAPTNCAQPLSNMESMPVGGLTQGFCGQVVLIMGKNIEDYKEGDTIYNLSVNTTSQWPSNQLRIFRPSTTSRLQFEVRVGGSGSFYTWPVPTGLTAGDTLDMRWKKNSSGIVWWLNGVKNSSATGGGTFSSPLIHSAVGGRTWVAGAYDFDGVYIKVRLNPNDLSDAEIEAWT